MVALAKRPNLDFGGIEPNDAREEVRTLLRAEPKATRRVYAAFARKVWSLLIERRLDDEIRDWHQLVHAVGGHVRASDSGSAERLEALGDLLRESISLADSSPALAVLRRPQARRLVALLKKSDGFVPRRALLAELGIKTSHLSNIIAQLSAHSLIERLEDGKEAAFKLTPRARELLGDAPDAPHSTERLLAEVRKLRETAQPRRSLTPPEQKRSPWALFDSVIGSSVTYYVPSLLCGEDDCLEAHGFEQDRVAGDWMHRRQLPFLHDCVVQTGAP